MHRPIPSYLPSRVENASVLQGASKANAFTVAQMNIAQDARLTGREGAMKLATKTLARALRRQIEVSAGDALKLVQVA